MTDAAVVEILVITKPVALMSVIMYQLHSCYNFQPLNRPAYLVWCVFFFPR